MWTISGGRKVVSEQPLNSDAGSSARACKDNEETLSSSRLLAGHLTSRVSVARKITQETVRREMRYIAMAMIVEMRKEKEKMKKKR